ncbi:MAG: hypothetical protein IMZ52_05120 [Actinobacteria bacterium]|nr:hypothetical protein [Actinomycetota bacterium]
MEIKNYGKNKVMRKGNYVSVVIIPLKDLNEGLADARRELKEYQNLEDMDIAQGYGYREGTIGTLNWIKNFKNLVEYPYP